MDSVTHENTVDKNDGSITANATDKNNTNKTADNSSESAQYGVGSASDIPTSNGGTPITVDVEIINGGKTSTEVSISKTINYIVDG